MFDLNDLLLENDNVDESCDSEHTEITSPDDGSGVKGTKEEVTDEGFMYYECEIDESNIIDGDPFEFITEAMYQNVINANNISIAVLADKYKYLKENGTEMDLMTEAAEEQDAKKKNAISKWFAAARDKLGKFIDTIVNKMMTLQAKFLMLFKKARSAAEAGFKSKNIEVPGYMPVEVKIWVDNQLEDLEAGMAKPPVFPKKDTKDNGTFESETNILKKYGECIKLVKTAGRDAQNRMKQKEKECLKDDAPYYAKIGNRIIALIKEAVSLIMARVTAAAKAVNAALKKEKPKKEEAKAEEKKADEKKATGESASFLESLEMI